MLMEMIRWSLGSWGSSSCSGSGLGGSSEAGILRRLSGGNFVGDAPYRIACGLADAIVPHEKGAFLVKLVESEPPTFAQWASLRAGSLSNPLVREYLYYWLAVTDRLASRDDSEVVQNLRSLLQLAELRAEVAATSDLLVKGLGAECWDWVRTARDRLSKALLQDYEAHQHPDLDLYPPSKY
jgi:hypothetical protein